MSDIPPVSPPKKTGYRWLLILVALFCALPILMIVALVGFVAVRSSAVPRNTVPVQAARPFEVEHEAPVMSTVPLSTTQSMPAIPAPDDLKKRAQLVRIQLDFEDFETRFANGITFDCSGQGSRLLVPSAVFAPMKGKINGRLVTRNAGVPGLIEIGPEKMTGPPMVGMGMSPGMGMGGALPGANLSVVREFPEIGLTELFLSNWELTPVRVLGDFPEASIGDKLIAVSLPPVTAGLNQLTVLGVDESVQISDGSKIDHLLKLTESLGTVGELLLNVDGEPIGQVIYTSPGKLRYSYAVPMGRVFETLHDNQSIQGKIEDQSVPSGRDTFGPSTGPPPERASEPRVPVPLGNPSQIPATFENPLVPNVTQQTGELGPADASSPEYRNARVTKVYRVIGSAPEEAEAVRSLYGDVSKIAVDRGSQSIIVVADPSIHEQISTLIEDLNTRTQTFQDEAKKSMARKETEEAETSKQRQRMEAEKDNYAARMALEDEEQRKNPKRTRSLKITGRDPKEVSKILSDLFSPNVGVALDERSGSVLITVNRAVSSAAAQSLLAEVEATATRLEQSSSPPATQSVSVPGDSSMRSTILEETSPRNTLYSEQDREARQLARQLRSAALADQPALRIKLERLTEQQFQTRQKLRKQEIDDLDKRIDQLRVTHLRRQQNQAEIIRRRVEELPDPNNDLRWEQSQANTEIPADVPSVKDEESTKVEASIASNVEQTFDGIGYSQWLKILETEVKPTKLAAAMEACGRLAAGADRRRIAKLIIQKASLFEAADSKERDEVWNAANASLAKFPMTDVTNEMLISLADPESSKRGRTFQGRFILRFSQAVRQRHPELIAELVKAAQENGNDRNCLLAAACQLWRDSDHRLDDFEGLRPLVVERFDSAPGAADNDWYVVADTIVAKNPETPDLAIKLMKYSARDDDFARMLQRVGQLGRHAEPAVPAIIEQILAELKKLESDDDDSTGARVLPPAVARSKREQRVIQLVRTLGSIGVGDKAATLLKELCLISASHGESSIPFAILREAQNALEKFPPTPHSDGPPILSDEFLIRGIWQLQSLNSEIQAGYEAWIAQGIVNLGRVQNGTLSSVSIVLNKQLIGGHLKLDPTKMPKEVVISMPGPTGREPKRNGIYELTETTLKIYLAPPGKPGPEVMIQNGAEVPDGYSLVELQRSPSVPPRP